MKRARRFVALAFLVFMVSTIPILAVFQYRWLGEVADAERREMLANMQRSLYAMRADLAGELTAIRDIFAVGFQASGEPEWQILPERLAFWGENTRFPGLIESVYAVDLSDAQPQYFAVDGSVEALEEQKPPLWLAEHALVENPALPPDPTRSMADSVQTVGRIVLPIVENPRRIDPQGDPGDAGEADEAGDDPPRASLSGLVAVSLDLEYFGDVVLPSLASERFGATGPESEIAVAITVESTDEVVFSSIDAPISDPDLTARLYPTLLSLNTRNFAIAPPASSSLVLRSPDVVSWVFRSAQVRERRLDADEDEDGSPGEAGRTLSAEREELRTFIMEADPPIWRVAVAHTAGSLSEIVRRQRRRNMTITGSVLAVLALSLIALYVLWRRAEALADRERMFVAGISHEIRTPLAAIYSAGENLAEGIVSEARQVRRYGSLIRNEGSRLRSMVEEILLFARLQADGGSLSAGPVVLAPLLEESAATARRDAMRPGSVVEVGPVDATVRVLGNHSALRLVFENLAGNALKHNTDGTHVRLDAKHRGERVTVEIQDDGGGMSRRDLRRAKTPFYRGTRAVMDQTPGSGLGLALADRIVRHHGGTLRVESVPGNGTTVYVELPVAPGGPETDAIDERTEGSR
jgi:signal transduction histidine kinase